MPDSEIQKQALVVALRLLASTPKSRHQLSDRLMEKGFPQTVIQAVLDQLESQNILSDRRYAQDIATRFTMVKPSGRQRIAFELKRKGISASIREEVLEQLDPEGEIQAAREVAKAKWDRLSKLPEESRKKKVYDFVIRRGFDFQTVRMVVDELLREEKNES